MNRTTFAGAVVSFAVATMAMAQPVQFQLNTVPDFSQKHNAMWRNYCAPTVGADWVYHFANMHPALRQGNPVGPGMAADNGVDGIIGGVPPAAGTLAQLMGTTPNAGTTLVGCANGLDGYLEATDGLAGNANWSTTWVLTANFAAPSGQNFFTAIQQTLSSGGGVILAVHWPNGAPAGYDTPDDYNPSDTNPESPMGHALALTGYNTLGAVPTISINDPANNMPVAAHNWPGENLVLPVVQGAGGLPNAFSVFIGGVPANVYGAVLTIPGPTAGSGLLFGLAVVCARRRR